MKFLDQRFTPRPDQIADPSSGILLQHARWRCFIRRGYRRARRLGMPRHEARQLILSMVFLTMTTERWMLFPTGSGAGEWRRV